MNYKTNGIFLAKRSYTLTDQRTGEVKDNFGYDFLVYDSKEDFGLAKPRVVTITASKLEPLANSDGLHLMDRVEMIVDLSFNKADGTYKPKYTGIERIIKKEV